MAGLAPEETGPAFATAEAAASDGHSDKLHVWEWRRRDDAAPPAPAPAEGRAQGDSAGPAGLEGEAPQAGGAAPAPAF